MVKAPIGKRVVAYIIDVVIIFVLAFAINIAVAILGFVLGYVSNALSGLSMLLMFPAMLVPFGYMLFRDGLGSGRSMGKKFMKLKVVKETGAKCSYVDSLLRNVVALVPVVGIIELIIPFIDEEGKRFGDKIAKTQVVEE